MTVEQRQVDRIAEPSRLAASNFDAVRLNNMFRGVDSPELV